MWSRDIFRATPDSLDFKVMSFSSVIDIQIEVPNPPNLGHLAH